MEKIYLVSNLDEALENLTSLFTRGIRSKILEPSAKTLSNSYKKLIKEGKNSDGSSMAQLSENTLNMPIRRSSENQIRPDGPPMNATGKSVESIGYSVVGESIEIGPQDSRGMLTFSENAYASGNVKKPIRDPLTVSDVQLDLVENIVLKEIEVAINE